MSCVQFLLCDCDDEKDVACSRFFEELLTVGEHDLSLLGEMWTLDSIQI